MTSLKRLLSVQRGMPQRVNWRNRCAAMMGCSGILWKALADRELAGQVFELVERSDGSVNALRQQCERATQTLRQSVLQAAMRSALFLRDLIWRELTRAWLGDGVLLDRLVQHALPYTSIESAERASLVEAQKSLREQHSRLVERVCTTIQQGQEAIVLLVDVIKSLLDE